MFDSLYYAIRYTKRQKIQQSAGIVRISILCFTQFLSLYRSKQAIASKKFALVEGRKDIQVHLKPYKAKKIQKSAKKSEWQQAEIHKFQLQNAENQPVAT